MRALALLLLGGCEFAFPLDPLDQAPPGDMPDTFDHCSPNADRDLRYATVRTADASPWSWTQARQQCQLRGMDLAVFNDSSELGGADVESWPYWVGAVVGTGGWTGVDGCTIGASTQIQHIASGELCGVATDPLELSATACDGATATESGMIATALCETPRPATADCVPRDPAQVTYTLSPAPMQLADARRFCAGLGAHVVVVDSRAAWQRVGGVSTTERVWIGSTFDGTTWTTETACPALYSWAGAGPNVADGTCLTTSLRFDADANANVVDGMAASPCTGSALALCESD